MVLTVGVVDGFDHYPSSISGTGGFGTVWQLVGAGGTATPSFTTGYRGRGKRLEMSEGLLSDAGVMRTVPPSKQISMHIASQFAHFDTTQGREWLSFRNASNAEIFTLYTLPTQKLALYQAGVFVGQTAQIISLNVAHRFNLAVDITSPSSCDIQMWVDGDPNKGFHLSGVDAVNSTANVELIRLSQGGYGASADGGNDHGFDDFVYCYGAATNIGELEVITNGPTSDTQKQWIPLTGTDNYAMVDEIPPNLDTDYNSSSVVGNIDLQKFPALPTAVDSIFCLSQIFCARKEEAGTRGFAAVMKGTGANVIGPTQNVATTYDYFYQHYLQNPDTLAAWLAAERTAASFGYEDAL